MSGVTFDANAMVPEDMDGKEDVDELPAATWPLSVSADLRLVERLSPSPKVKDASILDGRDLSAGIGRQDSESRGGARTHEIEREREGYR